MHAPKDTHGAGSRAEWDAATPNTLEVRSDRSWLSLAHFWVFVIAPPPIFDLSRGGGRSKWIASLLFQHWDTTKNEYGKIPMWPFIDIRGGRAQASITIQYVAGQPKYEVPFPAKSSAAPLRGDYMYLDLARAF